MWDWSYCLFRLAGRFHLVTVMSSESWFFLNSVLTCCLSFPIRNCLGADKCRSDRGGSLPPAAQRGPVTVLLSSSWHRPRSSTSVAAQTTCNRRSSVTKSERAQRFPSVSRGLQCLWSKQRLENGRMSEVIVGHHRSWQVFMGRGRSSWVVAGLQGRHRSGTNRQLILPAQFSVAAQGGHGSARGGRGVDAALHGVNAGLHGWMWIFRSRRVASAPGVHDPSCFLRSSREGLSGFISSWCWYTPCLTASFGD